MKSNEPFLFKQPKLCYEPLQVLTKFEEHYSNEKLAEMSANELAFLCGLIKEKKRFSTEKCGITKN